MLSELSVEFASNSAIEFYLVTLVVRSRNCGVEYASNVDRIRVPTVDDQPYLCKERKLKTD